MVLIRLVGSLKYQGSFAKIPHRNRALFLDSKSNCALKYMGYLIFACHFLRKSRQISGSFEKNTAEEQGSLSKEPKQ